MPEHHHVLYQAHTRRTFTKAAAEPTLRQLLLDLADLADAAVLIPPALALSSRNAWTGIMGIVTSHIAFHYWIDDSYVQIDVYSCADFDSTRLISFLDTFWGSYDRRALIVDRGHDHFFVSELGPDTPPTNRRPDDHERPTP